MSISVQPVEYQHGNVRLIGYLAAPAAAVNRPAVLVGPEWWGVNDFARDRARDLAALGYVALVVDMYGDGRTTADAGTASAWAAETRTGTLGRARSTAALEWLTRHPGVDPDRVAGVGFCFGGSVMLELARSGAAVRGVASFHGSLATPLPAVAGTVRASVLALHGADDPYVSTDEVLAFQVEMRAAGVDWRMEIFGGAVHSFTNPAADRADIAGLRYHEPSARRGWRTFLDFLEEALGSRSVGPFRQG